ncbi:Retrovirus-related Pol polyprotein from transposon TNT 1-94, partial [Araneus ventricosus]
GAEAWRILKKHFDPTTRARVIQLLDEFFNTRFETGEALGVFLCHVKQGAERLLKIGHQLQPLYQGYQMIRSLPAEYQSIVQTIYRWTDAEFQPDKIESELLLEENRLRLTRKDLDTVSSIAFSNEMYQKEAGNYYKQDEKLKTKSSKVRRFKNKTSNVKNKQIGPCYFCKSYGHLIANCKHKAALSNPKTNESSNTEFKVKGAFFELESNLIETFPDSHEANSSDFSQNTRWVFDTAATAHFCSYKSLYYSFEPGSNIQMTLAVGEKESPVEGKGIIHFLVQDKDVLSQGRYFFTIVDDFSHKVTVFPIRNKSDAFQTFIRFQKRAERFLNRKVISVRTDGGLEFCNQEFEKFLDKLGIRHEKTNSYSPEMNGVAERFNLTALDGVKVLLKSSGMSQKFWAEALLCFTYGWNRVCHKNKRTPFELYSGRKPSVSHLKKFGCVAYVGVPKQTRKKLDMRAKLGIMCGYAQTTKGYRILLLEDQRVIETINVRFDETKRGG